MNFVVGILGLCLAQRLSTQTVLFESFSSNLNHEFFGDAVFIKDTILAYSFYDPYEDGSATLGITNMNTDISHTYNVIPEEFFEYDYEYIFDIDAKIYFLGTYHSQWFDPGGRIVLSHYDQNTNQFATEILSTDYGYPRINCATINNDDNLVLIGFDPQNLTQGVFIVEYSLDGDVLNFTQLPVIAGANMITQLSDNTYRIFRNGDKFLQLDNEFNLIDEFYSNVPIGGGKGVVWNEVESGFWSAGRLATYYWDDSLNSTNSFYSACISKYILDNNFAYYIIDTIPESNVLHSIIDFDGLAKFQMYFAINYDVGSFAGWDGNSIIPFDDATLKMYAVDSSATVLWERFLGGDANYNLRKVLATPDSGCIVFANRYDPHHPETGMDIYYLKLDKDGNPQPGYLDVPTSINPPTTSIPPTMVFYDALADVLHCQFVMPDHLLNIYDLSGRLIDSQLLNSSIYSTAQLSSGLYLYVLTTADGIVKEQGRFAK